MGVRQEQEHKQVQDNRDLLSGSLYVLGTDGPSTLARDFFLRHFPREQVDLVFTPDGEFFQSRSLAHDLSMKPDELVLGIAEQYGYAYMMVDQGLMESKETGFASHGLAHSTRVVNRMWDVCKRFAPNEIFGENTEVKTKFANEIVVAGMFHDMKMIIGRMANDLDMEVMLKKIYPDWEMEQESFDAILHAINHHSEGVAINDPNFKTYPLLTLLLILADKADWTNKRLIGSGKPNGLDVDGHTQLAAYVSELPELIVSYDKCLHYDVDFSRIDRNSVFTLKDWLKEGDKIGDLTIRVASAWKHLREKFGYYYSASFFATIMKVYPMRLALVGLAAREIDRRFGYNELESFKFTVHDWDAVVQPGTEPYFFKDFNDVRRPHFETSWLFHFYLQEKNKVAIREALKNGKIPDLPLALTGGDPRILLAVYDRHKLNLNLADSRVEEKEKLIQILTKNGYPPKTS